MKSIKNLRFQEEFQKYLPIIIKQIQQNKEVKYQENLNQNDKLEMNNSHSEKIVKNSQSPIYDLYDNAVPSALDMNNLSLNPIYFLLNKSLVGQKVSHYEIVEKLGAGGMGVVYKAKDLILERFVTIKFLPPHLLVDDTAKKRFIHEARSLSSLDHPNICSIYEICETREGFLFIVMPYYQGRTLRSMIDDVVGTHGNVSFQKGVGAQCNAPLPTGECIDIMIQSARGLAKAHTKGVVHRDIKPENIIISEDNVVKIIDFGLSKLNESTKLSAIGATMGTMHYMSPEQTWGLEVDHHTDIWSLGVVFYEMLSGNLPFRGSYEQAIIYSIVNEEPEKVKHIPEKLWKIVKKCLTKDTQGRYENMRELIADLQDCKSRYLQDSTEYNVKSLNKIKRKWAILALVIMMILPTVIDWF